MLKTGSFRRLRNAVYLGNRSIVDFKGRQIPVLSLTDSAKIYALFGREKDLQKALLIERYLAERT